MAVCCYMMNRLLKKIFTNALKLKKTESHSLQLGSHNLTLWKVTKLSTTACVGEVLATLSMSDCNRPHPVGKAPLFFRIRYEEFITLISCSVLPLCKACLIIKGNKILISGIEVLLAVLDSSAYPPLRLSRSVKLNVKATWEWSLLTL